MDAATQPQELGLVRPSMEELIMSNSNSGNMMSNTSTPRPTNIQLQANSSMERRLVRPQREQALNCPRCNSANTKFCYYNNYSLTQPRYFCKACRRYWTEGGSLRNVPVGGGSRKSKKSSSTPSLPTLPKKIASADHAENPMFRDRGQDLSLEFPSMNPFAPSMPPMAPIVPEYLSSEYHGANTLRFPFDIDGVGGSGASGGYESGGGGGRLVFPFEEAKIEVNDSNGSTDFKGLSGFWNGMMRGGGGSSSW